MLPDPGRAFSELEGMPVLCEELPGELGLSIVREEPVVLEDIPLPGDAVPPVVWLWTKAGTVNAVILTTRNACHSLLFFMRLSFLILSQRMKRITMR